MLKVKCYIKNKNINKHYNELIIFFSCIQIKTLINLT